MAYLDSGIGYLAGALSDPTPAGYSDSLIGFVASALSDPVQRRDSSIGFGVTTLQPVHRPVVMLTSNGHRRTVIRSFDGTAWR